MQSERTPDRSQGGLGIGLSVVKRLVEMHGGAVGVASEGDGTRHDGDDPLAAHRRAAAVVARPRRSPARRAACSSSTTARTRPTRSRCCSSSKGTRSSTAYSASCGARDGRAAATRGRVHRHRACRRWTATRSRGGLRASDRCRGHPARGADGLRAARRPRRSAPCGLRSPSREAGRLAKPSTRFSPSRLVSLSSLRARAAARRPATCSGSRRRCVAPRAHCRATGNRSRSTAAAAAASSGSLMTSRNQRE